MKVKPIDSHPQAAFATIGPRTLASGMAAREGEDPLAGLQRSSQPGPQGDAHPHSKIPRRLRCNDCEQHILWAEYRKWCRRRPHIDDVLAMFPCKFTLLKRPTVKAAHAEPDGRSAHYGSNP